MGCPNKGGTGFKVDHLSMSGPPLSLPTYKLSPSPRVRFISNAVQELWGKDRALNDRFTLEQSLLQSSCLSCPRSYHLVWICLLLRRAGSAGWCAICVHMASSRFQSGGTYLMLHVSPLCCVPIAPTLCSCPLFLTTVLHFFFFLPFPSFLIPCGVFYVCVFYIYYVLEVVFVSCGVLCCVQLD